MAQRFPLDVTSAALALILAFMVWLVANESQRPMTSVQVPPMGDEPLPIAFDGLAEGLAVFDASGTSARVSVRGVSAQLPEIDRRDVRVWVDLDGQAPTTDLVVPVHAACADCGGLAARIISVAPSTVTLTIEPAISRTQPVHVELAERVPTTCRRVEASTSPSQVIVEGATSRVSRVERVVATVGDGSAAEQSVTRENVPLVAEDGAGGQVSRVDLQPPEVDVQVQIVDVETCAEVAVVPVYSPQNPPQGYYVSDIAVEPDRVEIQGEPERIELLQRTVSTLPVDISGAQDRVTRRVQLDLPEGLTPVGAEDGVTVTITVSPYSGSRAFEVEVVPGEPPAGLAIESVSPQRVQVFLAGPVPILDTLDVESLQARLELTGLSAGVTRVRPRLEVPAGIRVRSATPSDVEVRLVPVDRATALPTAGG